MQHAFAALGAWALVSGFLACATPPQVHYVDRTASIGASFADTWAALVGVVSDRGWDIQTIEKDSGILDTAVIRLDDSDANRYMDCGSAPLATTVASGMKVNIHVSDNGGTASVTINARFRTARSFDGNAGNLECSSTGRLESDLQAEIEDRARAIAAKHKRVMSDAGTGSTNTIDGGDMK